MLDTNIFNALVDTSIDIKFLERTICFVTHNQLDDIEKTPDVDRKEKLKSKLINIDFLETSSFVLNVSRLNAAKLSNGILYNKMRDSLDKINKNKRNNSEDIPIADTSVQNNLILITHDKDLFSVITQFDGAACNLFHLINQ